MWPSSRVCLLLALTVLTALMPLAGCASTSGNTGLSTSLSSPTSTAVRAAAPTASTSPRAPTTLASAWGQVTIHQLPSALADNRVFVFENAATPDGQWLVGANEPRDFLQNTTRLSYATLYNITTGHLVTIRPLLHPQSQILAISVDDRWIVWSEADDQPDFFDWTLFAYDRQLGTTRRLAAAALVAGKPVQGPTPMPVVDHGYAIWGQALGPVTADNLTNAVVRMENLTTGAATTVATKAGNPTLAWPWISWGQITTGSAGYMALKNLETGQEAHLQRQPASVAMAGRSLAYDDTATVYLIDDVARDVDHVQTLATAATDADHLQFVTLNDRLVAWVQDGVTQVWDRALQRLVVLPVTNGQSDSWVGGHTLVWPEPEPSKQQDQDARDNVIPAPTFNVIDTRTLPPARP